MFSDIRNPQCLRTFLISDMTVARLGITIWLSCRPAVTNRSSCSHCTRASCSWDLWRQFFITTRLESNLLQIVHSILQPGKIQKTFQLIPFKYCHFKKVISETIFLAWYVCYSYVHFNFNTDFFWKIIIIAANLKRVQRNNESLTTFFQQTQEVSMSLTLPDRASSRPSPVRLRWC